MALMACMQPGWLIGCGNSIHTADSLVAATTSFLSEAILEGSSLDFSEAEVTEWTERCIEPLAFNISHTKPM